MSKTQKTNTKEKKEVKKGKRLEKKPKYYEAVGRRKTATARVRLFTQGEKEILVNGKPYKEYFSIFSLQKKVQAPLEVLNCLGKFGFSILVKGGGLSAQAEACRHGIARSLVLLNPLFKKRLKKAGFLTRDPRMRERKKPGLKRARRAPQWSKR
jgi:small subunit ribosomal protein S9